MTSPAPDFGLLLDVDGPIASPVARTIAIPSIASDLVTLANAGVPIVFNTGRSDRSLQKGVVGYVVDGGLSEDARVFGVCEKGAVWFRITPAGIGDLSIDETLVPPPELARAVDDLVATRFSDWMFFDHSKRTMISVEQRTDVHSDDYLAKQPEFDRAVLDLCRTFDFGVMWRNESFRAADGRVLFRIDPSIIATDIESIRVGKDLGAERALALLARTGHVPHTWRTMGDSRSDYAMADWLHSQRYDVVHIDVRPTEGPPEKEYRVLTPEDGATNDAVGAVFLRRWVQSIVDGITPDGPA
ncbi:hypothetical protein N1027_08425 [Herbiconiux sp. CPCC 205763]|uniref:Hydroxymethylpyrimidine pyrophosphatase-like HAD family hydrolase n=1 Tax=Herbiconiux aconitum TaxID=2970913 RepID=A0ABT2GPV4_9MICO|nr:hypothetical protein [Herbiconiux aconitum]MCS5718161.1 hypothetical protein [Herbiconiux aconitum]